jgi:hypothetical protein
MPRGTVRRETGLLQHAPQIHQNLDADVLTVSELARAFARNMLGKR